MWAIKGRRVASARRPGGAAKEQTAGADPRASKKRHGLEAKRRAAAVALYRGRGKVGGTSLMAGQEGGWARAGKGGAYSWMDLRGTENGGSMAWCPANAEDDTASFA